MLAIAALGLIENFPFTRYEFSPYQKDTPWKPYQRLVDYANRNGGLAFWAHPESPSFAKPKRDCTL